jgi:hypothetical protein
MARNTRTTTFERRRKMTKGKTNWEPDIKKSFNIGKNIKDLKQQQKDDADRRKIDGFNPGDLFKDSGKPFSKK